MIGKIVKLSHMTGFYEVTATKPREDNPADVNYYVEVKKILGVNFTKPSHIDMRTWYHHGWVSVLTHAQVKDMLDEHEKEYNIQRQNLLMLRVKTS